MEQVINLTKENIQEVVEASNQQAIVLLFWAQQSPESVELGSTLENMTRQQPGRFIFAKVDCELEQEIAGYFRIQSVPTCMVLKQGQPVDGFAGMQNPEQIGTMLDKHLPALWELDFQQGKELLVEKNAEAALPLLKSAYSESLQRGDVALALVDAYLMINELTTAEALLDDIKLEDQDGYYQNLKAKLELAKEAADTPEIRELQTQFESNPEDFSVLIQLSKALHQAGRDEEALTPLFAVLSADLNAENGAVKQAFMEILTALGQGHSLASQYRRKLYSLLY
ncbi:co-chaperone YbbN [Shewanella gelidii]|uniref:Co-chaperone YbbN n=1 Tax=Shewanella gelidii TaxID=1642821 RepID=A0A917JM28_9GAMM|nr:co-chaperone YbbN [Shewanella gelidii]MCL1097527.1 co-chaperone YbbN [Shewanella gelidii]GGI75964.1 co-chaperone YbbN [Shewanella gelidii]